MAEWGSQEVQLCRQILSTVLGKKKWVWHDSIHMKFRSK